MASDHSLAGLKDVRTLLHFRTQDLAARIGVTLSSYSRFERGDRRIYFDKACALADMLGVDPGQLRTVPEGEARRQLWERGEQRRQLLDKTGGDAELADQFAQWHDEEPE